MNRIGVAVVAAILVVSADAQTPPAGPPPTPPQTSAPAGPPVPRNLKVLTGLSIDEVRRTMQVIGASLGVRCEFCHVEGTDGLDFANDSKEEKETARSMIEMVRRLNTTSFEGHPIVSCYTCHQGSAHPVNIIPLPVKLPPADANAHGAPAPATQGAEAPPTAESLLAAYAKASSPGKVANRSLRGTMTDLRGPASLEVLQSGDRMLVHIKTGTRETTLVASGDSGWIRDARGTRDMNASDLQRFRETNLGLQLPLLDPKAAGWRTPRKEKLGDADTWRLDRRVSDLQSERYWFDPRSGVLLRMVLISAGPVGRVPQQVDFADYRDVGGVRVPFSIVNSLVEARASTDKKFETADASPIDPTRFAKP